MNYTLKTTHNHYAPYWAAGLLIMLITGLSTTWFKWGGFWNGYVLDMVGPGWTYILFRGLFTGYTENRWRQFFTPVRTFILLAGIAFGIETMQYFKLYDATFDPLDLVAYLSVLVPLLMLDLWQNRRFTIDIKKTFSNSL